MVLNQMTVHLTPTTTATNNNTLIMNESKAVKQAK